MIRGKLKEIFKLQDIIKKYDLNYKSKREKIKILINIHYCFLRDINEGYLSTEKADNKQSHFAYELKNFEKGARKLEKEAFSNNLELLNNKK